MNRRTTKKRCSEVILVAPKRTRNFDRATLWGALSSLPTEVIIKILNFVRVWNYTHFVLAFYAIHEKAESAKDKAFFKKLFVDNYKPRGWTAQNTNYVWRKVCSVLVHQTLAHTVCIYCNSTKLGNAQSKKCAALCTLNDNYFEPLSCVWCQLTKKCTLAEVALHLVPFADPDKQILHRKSILRPLKYYTTPTELQRALDSFAAWKTKVFFVIKQYSPNAHGVIKNFNDDYLVKHKAEIDVLMHVHEQCKDPQSRHKVERLIFKVAYA